VKVKVKVKVKDLESAMALSPHIREQDPTSELQPTVKI